MNPIASAQLDQNGALRHFLSPEGLGGDMLTAILDKADQFIGPDNNPVKKLPLLRGKTVTHLFFENSTRTRTTFELAAERLSADIMSLDIRTSSTSKGETVLDTLQTLEAMQTDLFVVRHASSGAAHYIASIVPDHVSVVNAGDGRHAHPTQALLDLVTIRREKGQFDSLKICLAGDLLHSRVARSQIHALKQLGVRDLRVIGPKTLLPDNMAALGVTIHRSFDEAIEGCDVVMMLRLQNERMNGTLLPSASEYFEHYGLDQRRLKLAAPDAIVLHPGPINRGIEIADDVADGPQSVILKQVRYGLALRMAILTMTLGREGAAA